MKAILRKDFSAFWSFPPFLLFCTSWFDDHHCGSFLRVFTSHLTSTGRRSIWRSGRKWEGAIKHCDRRIMLPTTMSISLRWHRGIVFLCASRMNKVLGSGKFHTSINDWFHVGFLWIVLRVLPSIPCLLSPLVRSIFHIKFYTKLETDFPKSLHWAFWDFPHHIIPNKIVSPGRIDFLLCPYI